MPLGNCRALRDQRSHQYQGYLIFLDIFNRRAAFRYNLRGKNALRGGGGNFAYFIISGTRRLNVNFQIPGLYMVKKVGADHHVIMVRNEGVRGNGLHSEALAINIYNRYFRLYTIDYVFTEREPCHEGRGGGCHGLLEVLLGMFGANGRNTPVRYLEPWLNRNEKRAAKELLSNYFNADVVRKNINFHRKEDRDPGGSGFGSLLF